MVTVLLTLLGVGLNVFVLHDIFHTLFAPSGTGALSGAVARAVWRAFHLIARRYPDLLSLAGPLAMLTIVLLWTAGIILGWAFVLWPHLPDRFLLSTGLAAEHNDSFLDAMYVSMVTLGTLGYGEITPHATWMRMVVPLEALLGFALFTASISWNMSIYPALARRRHLARHIALLDRTQERTGITLGDSSPSGLSETLRDLTSQVIAVRDDFVQFPITYFFHASDAQSSLEAHLPSLLRLGRTAASEDDRDVQVHATILLEALEDLASRLAKTWLNCEDDADIEQILRAYVTDHLRTPQ